MRLAPVLLAVLCAATLVAEDGDGKAQAPVTGETQAAMLRTTAEAKATAGRQALQVYRKDPPANPNAVVDAALAFADAQRLYRQLGDSDGMAEMQANLFWCRKQMDLTKAGSYLADKGRSEALSALQSADQPLAGTEAQAYFDRARAFADAHPTDFNEISIRYYEVAQRFLGTPLSLEAQKLSLAAQTRYAEQLVAGAGQRDTLFTKRAAIGSGPAAIPDDKTQRATQVELRKLYAKGYSARSDPAKRRFAAKPADEAQTNKGDASTYYTMLAEVCRLAQESDDFPRLLATADLLGAAFTGYDPLDQKRLLLRKSSNRTVAAAVTTLLDQSSDAAANATAGKFFCFTLLRWAEGLPLLSLGNDADLKALAEQELAGPATDDQRVQVAEGWYALGRKTSIPAADRTQILFRAQHWYLEAKDLAGLAKERVAQRLAELDRVLPLDLESLDWAALTPAQWDKLRANPIAVPVRVDRSGPLASLRAGEQLRVVPHPTDSWVCQAGPTRVNSIWSGNAVISAINSNGDLIALPYPTFPFGALVCKVGTNDPLPCGIVSGPGPLWVAPNRPSGDNKGQIRVKLIPLDSE